VTFHHKGILRPPLIKEERPVSRVPSKHNPVLGTYLSYEGLEVGVIEVAWQYGNFKSLDVRYFEGALVGTPTYEIIKFSLLK
jgi:hypothetical protein